MTSVAETATLAHGYTMADVDRIANWAATRYFGTGNGIEDRRENAWFAVVEVLYASSEAPPRHELVRAAKDAVREAVDENLRAHGKRRDGGETHGFSKYWSPVGTQGDFTERIQESLALRQVLGELTGNEYEALAALAAFGDQGLARAYLGLSDAAFRARIRSARQRIGVLWYAPETPRDLSMHKRVGCCRYGHDLSTEGWISSSGRVRCRTCHRESARRRRAKSA